MNAPVITACQYCNVSIEIEYILLGVAIDCPACGKNTVPKPRAGILYPDFGYGMKFSNFQQLLSYPPYRRYVVPFLTKLYGYKIVVDKDATIHIRANDGTKVDLLALHQRIQADEKIQHKLYQLAMSLWR